MRCATRGFAALLAILAAIGGLTAARAADTTWTAAVNNDFFNPGNWDTNAAPTAADNVLILDPAKQAVINFAGSREIGSFHLGTSGATGGNVDFSAGELVVHADFDRSHIGDQGAADSLLVMRGTAVMLFDEPLDGGGSGYGSSGGNQDLEIGARTGATGNKGVLEMHDSAVLRLSDDLKIGAEANGNGEVLVDGSAQISAGSGISVSEANPSRGKLTVGGNALVVAGNSAGAGNAAQGVSDEGYFTLSVNVDSTAEVLIKDSGKVYARTLQQRNGKTDWRIQDNGEFHVFDTFHFAAPQLGVATVTGVPISGFDPVRASHISGGPAGSGFNLVIAGHAKMSIDSAVDDGSGQNFKGLAVAGGNNSGSLLTGGGEANIELRDQASFVIQQDLHLTAASSPTPVGASSRLRIVGPDVDAQVKGNLYMSYDPIFQSANADPSTLNAVITGSSHSTLVVGGEANIEFGNLAVELSGYSPVGGESYTLISAGSVKGSSFLNTDFTLAALAAGLSWQVDVNPTNVILKVLGSAGIPGDYDGDHDVDGNDFLRWQRGESPSPMSAGDLATWKMHFGQGAAAAVAGAVPEPCGLLLIALATGVLAANRRR